MRGFNFIAIESQAREVTQTLCKIFACLSTAAKIKLDDVIYIGAALGFLRAQGTASRSLFPEANFGSSFAMVPTFR